MVHGKPRHPQSQGSVERANGDIKDILVAWMSDNNTQDWTMGLKFVQQQKNCAHHAGINRTPYKAMFGEDPKVGLTSSSLPPELLQRLQSEEDLLELLESPAAATVGQTASEQASTTEPESHADCEQPSAVQCDHTLLQIEDTPMLQPSSSETLDERRDEILNQRKQTRESQFFQAERMVKRSGVDLKAGEVGDNVAIPIPLVDRGRGDPRNILGIIVDRNEQDLYTVAVRTGILTTRYSRNQFDLCPQRLLSDSDVNTDCTFTLRQAIRSSASGGQGFFHCECSKGKQQCQTNSSSV